MLWLWNRMVLFSFGVSMPTDVVLCYNSLLWKLLPQRSQRASRPSRFCNCCNGMFGRVVDHTGFSSILARLRAFHPSFQDPFKHCNIEIEFRRRCPMCVENKVPGMRKSKIVCYKMFQESQISILKAVHDKQPNCRSIQRNCFIELWDCTQNFISLHYLSCEI